jgi:tape measure domain-containing protein
MDLAQLGLKVDSSEVKAAAPALDDLRDSAKGAERAAEDFRGGAERAEKATEKLRTSSDGLGKTFGLLKAAVAGLVASFSIGLVADAADRYTEFNNRLKVAGVTAEEQVGIQQRLAAAANAGGAAIGAVGSLYAKASQSANDLGASQEKLLSFVDGVTAALKVNGGTAESTSGALMQLGQALGGGVVRAEEFNSILEGAPTIARAAALGFEQTGGSVSALRNMVIAGSVSSKEFFEAFLKGAETMKQQAGELSMTMGNSWTVLANGFTMLVGKLDETVGASGMVANAIAQTGEALTWLSFNLEGMFDIIVKGAITATPLLLGVFGPALVSAVSTLVVMIGTNLVGAVNAVAAAFEFLRVVMMANPVLAIATIILTVVTALYQFREELGLTTGKWAEFWQLLQNGWTVLTTLIGQLWTLLQPLLQMIWDLSMAVYGAIGEKLVQAFQLLWTVARPILEGLIFLLETIVEGIASIAGIDIGSKGAGAMAAAVENVKGKVIEGHTTGGNNAAGAVTNAMVAGGNSAAGSIKSAMTQGAAITAQQAQATYDRLNGTLIKPLGDTLVSGGKFIYNQVTGAVTKAGDEAAAKMQDGTSTGGDIAGQKIQQAMANGSQTVYNTIEAAFATLAPLVDVFSAFQRQLNSKLALEDAQANLLWAQARQLGASRSSLSARGSDGGGGGGGYGGSEPGMPDILNRNNRGSSANEVAATPGVWTNPAMIGGGGGGSSRTAPAAAAPSNNVTIVNQLSPKDQLASLETQEGKQVIYNVIKSNRDEFLAMLGAL